LAATSPFAQAIIRGVGRNRLSVAISVTFMAVAVATLYHLLHGIDVNKVVAAIEAQSGSRILVAAVLVAAGYSNLIFYDLFALHTIGKRNLPFPVVAFASFTSYTIGHSLGAATLTCGLVRFRVYSFWGLTVVDIAKIAFMTGVTFWLGNIFVLGGANWQIVLPNLRWTFLQIGIGTVDRCLASLSLFILLPGEPAVGFVTVVVVFVLATLLGAMSHTPGSLGVVEAAILIGLPQYPREDLLAIVLTFRVLDFFLPLLIATTMFGLRELRLIARTRKVEVPPLPRTL
jgi:hypothetical protein